MNAFSTLTVPSGAWRYVSLREAERRGLAGVSRLPYVLRIVLENLLRQSALGTGRAGDVETLMSWLGGTSANAHVHVRPARVMMDDTAGLPLIGDLAAMRDAAKRLGASASCIDLAIPVDFIVDHSVIADHTGHADALALNMALEMQRNAERYRFLRWAGQAFGKLRIFPPGRGICHQINLEYLAQVVRTDDESGLAYPDTMVGIDSHTPMANAMGVVAWGVSGIEGLSAALGEPVAMRVPEVVGCRLTGSLRAGVTATDLVLTLTQRWREYGVVGKVIEYFGPGLAALTLQDRATVANMTPEAGATMSYFPVDRETLRYLEATGRDHARIELVEAYAKAQNLWHDGGSAVAQYSETLEVDLFTFEPSVSGPRLPHGRVALREVPAVFGDASSSVIASSDATLRQRSGQATQSRGSPRTSIKDGDVVIAAVTSCTNTSNPALMIGAGLLARNAVRRGLKTQPWVKTSLSPGSRVVADYLSRSGLQESLDTLGFHVAGFGCMTCVGFSGPLDAKIAEAIEGGVRAAAVLSGNRNYEGRAHGLIRSTFLASPLLVIAYALAGTVLVDLTADPLGVDREGKPVYLHEIWPDAHEIAGVAESAIAPALFTQSYRDVFEGSPAWRALDVQEGADFEWDPASTFIRPPPMFGSLRAESEPAAEIRGARVLAMYGDMVTTEHISPMGPIPKDSPAARYLESLGIAPADFVSYAARRINYDVMTRGTFASPHLVSELTPGERGGVTRYAADGRIMTIFDAAQRYRRDSVPLVVIAGRAFGAGSSRDWSAKGPCALGVRAVIAESYERIYRSNLVAAGVLPLEFSSGDDRKSLALDGTEAVDITGLHGALAPCGTVRATFTRPGGEIASLMLVARLDTAEEIDCFRHGGLFPRLLRRRIAI